MDTNAAISFLRDLHTTSPRDAWLSGWCIDHDTGQKKVLWSTVHEPEVLVEQFAALQGRLSVFVGVAPRDHPLPGGQRGGAADCVGVPGLWLDLDVQGPRHTSQSLPPTTADAMSVLGQFPESPSVVIKTGGGLQAYWLFETFMPTGPDLTRLLGRWNTTWTNLFQERGWTVDNVWDVARVMRLPGSVNNKILSDPIPVIIEP